MLLVAVADFNWEDENFLGIESILTKETATDVFPIYQR